MLDIDTKILYSLDEDSAKSYTKIGQEIGLTPQLVKYHIKKLLDDGVILAFWPMIEFRKLGYFNVSYFIKLKSLSEKNEKEIIRYLKNENDFNILMLGDGYWDLHFTISSRNIFETVEVFNKFYDLFHNYILSYETAISVGFYQFRREYLNADHESGKTEIPMALTGADVKEMPINSTQTKIIEMLNKNCRTSYADLSNALKISREKAIYNLKKISHNNIIQSYALLLDADKLGYFRYRILLQMTNFTSADFSNFFTFCQNHPNIIHLLRLFGNWQALIDVEIENEEKLRLLIKKISQEYGDLILRIEKTHVYKIEKFRDIPFKLKSG